MAKHPCGYFFPSHKWGKWRKPLKRGTNKGIQFRTCLKCGELDRRKAKAPMFHIHRWRMAGVKHSVRAKATHMECKVIGCDKTKAVERRPNVRASV